MINRIAIGLAVFAALPSSLGGAAEPGTATDDVAAMEARVHELELQVLETKALVDATAGKVAKAPAGLPERFKQPELQSALRLAFKQVNSSAQLTDVDCSEYPCIAIGNGIATSQLAALKATPALQPYLQDDLSLFVWDDHVAVIAAPKGDPALGADGEQRILTRFHQMAAVKTSKGS